MVSMDLFEDFNEIFNLAETLLIYLFCDAESFTIGNLSLKQLFFEL